MKKVMLSLALVVGMTGVIFAQESTDMDKKGDHKHHNHHSGTEAKEIKSPEERARLFTAALDKQLNLSDAQEKEIYNIQLENAKNMEAMRKQHQADGKKHHAAGKSHAAGMDKIQSVLTDKQRITYQKLKEERMQKFKERRDQHQKDINSSGNDTTKTRKLRTKKAK